VRRSTPTRPEPHMALSARFHEAVTFSLQRRLQGVVAVAATALALMAGVGVYSAHEVAQDLERIQVRIIPRLELRPRLESGFERLSRAFHDAVAARDSDLLEIASTRRQSILDDLDEAQEGT